MRIVVAYGGGFPNSVASAEHIVSYSKGLVKLGHEVWVLALQPSIDKKNLPSQLPLVEGTYEGIHYYYPAKTIYWPQSRLAVLKKTYLKLKSFRGAYHFLKKNKADFLIHVIPTEEDYGLWRLLCKLVRQPFVIERTELSKIYKNQEYYNKTLSRRLYKKRIEKVFAYPDAWIVETKTLQNYYKRFAKPSASFHILPMTVEVERFSHINKREQGGKEYIAYCGNMQEVDGISILIKAFSQISNKYPNIELKLAGYSDDTPSQKDFVKQLGIEERVVFLGRIDRVEIPDFLGNARLLVLASPTSLRSCATMPCKVGEYLCTRVPVVVTGLGEIKNYLKDKENAYLSEPDSPDLFAKKMDEALSDTTENIQVIVEKGYQTVQKYFSANSQAETMLKIFEQISNNS